MIQWPSRLGGKPKLVGWLNRLLERCKAGEIKQIIGGRLIETSDGKTLIVDPGHGGGATTSTGGMVYRGEWSIVNTYAVQDVVTRGALGEFICISAITSTAPETGSPYWHGWSYPPPGVWA